MATALMEINRPCYRSCYRIYDEGYTAKRMEVGAVIAAAPNENVVREMPEATDIIILCGWSNGTRWMWWSYRVIQGAYRGDYCLPAEQKYKRKSSFREKIQRLFRSTTMIKRCNDFGAGGVAIGRLADGLEINLDKVPKKYED